MTTETESAARRPRMVGVSIANERLRELLISGATAVIRHVKPGRPGISAWLLALLERKPRKRPAVALANKMDLRLCAMLTSGGMPVRQANKRPKQIVRPQA